MRYATDPFEFVNASYLTRIRPERAETLAELGAGLRVCSDASVFYHTFESLERHHYTYFSSDFAQWVRAACNESRLAERLAAVDLRGCASLAALREAIAAPIEQHVAQHPASAARPAYEPFYFAEAVEITVPRAERATTVAELAEGIRHISLQTVHHHFINSRVRLPLQTNDFSNWVERALGLTELAARLNRIDIYVNTLEDLRQEILRALTPWVTA